MPVYEFYCADCHTVYNFFSQSVNTDKRPTCPKCGRPELERKASLFAISKGLKEDGGGMPDVDEARLEQALASMAGEFEGMNEDDPRAAARMMRKLFGASGLKLGPGMEEDLQRMEAGEDPESIEAEMGDVLEHEDPLTDQPGTSLKALRRLLPPRIDETWYPL